MQNQTSANRLLISVIVLVLFAAHGETTAANKFGSLAVGASYKNVDTVIQAGTVNIIRGSTTGLSSANNRLWNQNSDGMQGETGSGDYFGSSLASGDFNNDGYMDLAVGVAGDTVDGVSWAGAVSVIYGTAGGLHSANNQLWSQNSDGIADIAEEEDFFGRSLATGDFNNDGFADLAIGTPYEDIEAIVNGGAVNIIYGSEAGLDSANNQLWHQDSEGIEGAPETTDHFGSSLITGDFNNDGFTDLAIGVPIEAIGSIAEAGAVNVIYGSEAGLSNTNNQMWHQNSDGIKGGAEAGDHFGRSLASADFNNDGFTDLAIGVPLEAIGSIAKAGAVNIIYGSADSLTSTNNQFWSQDSDWIEGEVGESEHFGSSLAAGDFNNDGFEDLAVGTMQDAVLDTHGVLQHAGSTNIIYGSGAGLQATNNQLWSQGSTGIEGEVDNNDYFGSSLTAGDFNNDGFADLAVGVPYETFNLINAAGVVNIIYGSSEGLSSINSQLWSLDSDGIEGEVQISDLFGMTLKYIPPDTHIFPWPMYLPATTDTGTNPAP